MVTPEANPAAVLGFNPLVDIQNMEMVWNLSRFDLSGPLTGDDLARAYLRPGGCRERAMSDRKSTSV
jgi:hypothetical protein